MSIDTCDSCSAYIDTDDDCECYVTIADKLTVCLCPACREEREDGLLSRDAERNRAEREAAFMWEIHKAESKVP